MSLIVDISASAPDAHRYGPSPLGELGAMLHALAVPAHHPALHGWITATTSALPPDLADRLLDAEFLWRVIRADILLPAALNADLAADLDDLDGLDDEPFVAAALDLTCGSSGFAAPLTDQRTRQRVRELALARGPRQAAFTDRLLADPPAVRAWLRRLFEDCAEAFFNDAWHRVRGQLAADARHKADLAARQGLGAALAAMSPAITYDESRQRIVVDKLHDVRTAPAPGRGVTFTPSAFGAPHLLVVHAPGWQPVVHYPVRAAGTPDPPALDTVLLRLEALANPTRMRLCRMLARSAHTTRELAAFWQLSDSEVSRHLSVLKKAGLLTSRRRGRYVLHELDLTAGARLGADFLEALLR